MFGIRPWELGLISINTFNRLTKDVQTILDVTGVTGLPPMPSELDIEKMDRREQEFLNRNKTSKVL